MNVSELVEGETYLYLGRRVLFEGATASGNAAITWLEGPLAGRAFVDPVLMMPLLTRFDRMGADGSL